jgi:hypothetical protein
MKSKEWIFCDRCERVFQAEIRESPMIEIEGNECIEDAGILAGEFLSAFQPNRYPRCPYKGCNGTRLEFHWWFDVRNSNPGYPEIPTVDVRYPWVIELRPVRELESA